MPRRTRAERLADRAARRAARHERWGGKLPPWLQWLGRQAGNVSAELYQAIVGLALGAVLNAADRELRSGRHRHYAAVLHTLELAEQAGLDRDAVEDAVDQAVLDAYEQLFEDGEVE